MFIKNLTAVTMLTTMALAACAADPGTDTGEAPELEDVALDEQTVTNGGWTMSVSHSGSGSSVRGSAVLSGSGTTKSGVCLVNVMLQPSGAFKTCSVESDCGTNNPADPTWNWHYCLGFNDNQGTKYCMKRLGLQTSWCKGFTPPGSFNTLSAGTHYTPWQDVSDPDVFFSASSTWTGSGWTSYWASTGCLNGACGAGNTAVSSNYRSVTVNP